MLTPAGKATSPWADLNLGDAPQDGWPVQDHSADEFEAVVVSVLAAQDQTGALSSMQYLAGLLSSKWAAHFSHQLTATVTDSAGKW